jgi:hypothetical protein
VKPTLQKENTMSTKTATITIVIMLVRPWSRWCYPIMRMRCFALEPGEVDGYICFGGIPDTVLTPGSSFCSLPSRDRPLKATSLVHRPYNIMMVAFVIYMLYIYALTLLAALGYGFNMTFLLLP